MAGKIFNDDIKEFIKKNIKGKYVSDLTVMVNNEFGTNFTEKQINTYKCREKLKNGMPRKKFTGCVVFTEEMQDFIDKNIKGTSINAMTEMLNKEFGTNFTYNQMKGYLGRYGITNGIDKRFKKGRVPHNKGDKGHCGKGCEKTWFKKGVIPPNYKPIGSERINVDGYIEIKVADPNKWRLKQRVVWEEHNGPIPKGYAVIFLDGNKKNTDISNLDLVTRKELMILNKQKLIYDNAETTKSGVMIARLISTKLSKKKK